MIDSSSSPNILFKIIRWVVTLLALGLVVYLLIENWAAIWDGVLQIGGGRFVLLTLLILISRLLMALRWYLVLESTDVEVTFLSVLRVTFAGFFANNFMPSTIGGDVFRLTGAVLAGIGTAVSAASLLMDRVIGMIGMAILLPAGIVQLLGYDGDVVFNFGYSLPVRTGILMAQLKASSSKAAAWIKKAWKKLWSTLGLWGRRPLVMLPALIVTLVHQACLYSFIWLILDAFGIQMAWWMIAGLWSLVYFVTLLPISISGLGVQEVIILFSFQTLGGTSETAALILALLFRLVILLVSLPGALAVPALLPEARKREGD